MAQLAAGVLVAFMAGRLPNHELIGAIMFGMGALALALGVLIERADKQTTALDRLGKPKAEGETAIGRNI